MPCLWRDFPPFIEPPAADPDNVGAGHEKRNFSFVLPRHFRIDKVIAQFLCRAHPQGDERIAPLPRPEKERAPEAGGADIFHVGVSAEDRLPGGRRRELKITKSIALFR